MFNQQFYPNFMPNYPGYNVQPPAQVLTPQQPQISYVQVKSINDLAKYRVGPNMSYMGLNEDAKEIYVRRMNNDGNIESETYTLKSEEKEKSQLEIISEQLADIKNALKEKKNEQPNGYVNQQPVQQQAQFNAPNANVQHHDGW